MELLNELIDELELAEDAVVAKATDHIHAHELVLTLGLSTTTLRFLLKAAERRSFQVRSAQGLLIVCLRVCMCCRCSTSRHLLGGSAAIAAHSSPAKSIRSRWMQPGRRSQSALTSALQSIAAMRRWWWRRGRRGAKA